MDIQRIAENAELFLPVQGEQKGLPERSDVSEEERETGFSVLRDALLEIGVDCYAGVNGGGVIQFSKLLEPASCDSPDVAREARFFTVPEYVAGFVPLGHYLSSGRPAACLTTTGAATKLAGSGMSDAKVHNIPAVYMVALNPTDTEGLAPLQDVSDHGSAIVEQLRAEFGEACIHLTDCGVEYLRAQLDKARQILAQSKPVIIAFHPDILARPCRARGRLRSSDDAVRSITHADSEDFAVDFLRVSRGRRVIVLVTDEAARDPEMPALTELVSEAFSAPVVWTVNGAWGTDPDCRFGYGHIGFGGNDAANALWAGIGPDDILLSLGFEPGEYVLNLEHVQAGTVYHLTDWERPYGHIGGGFAHRCTGDYKRIVGNISALLKSLLEVSARTVGTRPRPIVPASLNKSPVPGPSRQGSVDFAHFLERLHKSWLPDSIGFDDVCMAYKDRQYVTQRKNPNVRFFSAYQGSSMGGAFGMAVGAKLATPKRTVFCFSGDGCYQMFAGALPQCSKLGLRLFIIDNQSYAIVNQGLDVILGETSRDRYHGVLNPVDHVAAARAYGWQATSLHPDLSNFESIMEECYSGGADSLLVSVPVDPWQKLGTNPRVANLTRQTHL